MNGQLTIELGETVERKTHPPLSSSVLLGVRRILNLEAGLGGNCHLWPDDVEVVSVEIEPKIAAVNQRLHPKHKVIVADAGQYLLDNHHLFDFVWSSPPCQTHSKMNKATRHKSCARYVDMTLWQRILFLQHHFAGLFCVENVVPYYAPLIQPTAQVGRHLFWSNFPIVADEVPQPANFINKCNLAGKAALMEWLGIHYAENIYYGTNHCPAQILRNCVHPKLGAQILQCARTPNAQVSRPAAK